MISRCFLKLTKKLRLIPEMFPIEDLDRHLMATVPPVTSEEYRFFKESQIVSFYEQDMDNRVVLCEPTLGEPNLLFHEFVFLLARIAITHVKTSPDVRGNISDLFSERLKLSQVADINIAKITFEDIKRRLS